MKLRMTDAKHNVEEALWGTCELCMGEGEFDFIEYEITPDDGGDPYWVDGYFIEVWDGPYEYEIENIPRFAAWLQEQDFPEGFVLEPEHLPYLESSRRSGESAAEAIEHFNNQPYLGYDS